MKPRTIVILGYQKKPPEELARITMDANGVVSFTTDVRPLRDHLKRGIPKPPKMKEIITMADGSAFMDAVLFEFSGTYTKAVELRST